jgi:hypothetical protein
MKKLVAIALVLAMASAASAGIGFVAVGGNDVNPGQVVVIELRAAEVMGGGFALGLLSDNGANGSMGAYTISQLATGFTVDAAGEVLNLPATGAGTSTLLYGFSASVRANQAANTVLFSFPYTVPMTAVGTINIGALATGTMYMYSDGLAYGADPSMANIMIGGAPTDVQIGGLVLNVIPEPMTLGLLGLGGLFLRRRVA